MKETIEEILAEINYRENPYFISLRDGSMEKEDFVETQIQFFGAVIFFSRPMAAVAAKIPGAQRRLSYRRRLQS